VALPEEAQKLLRKGRVNSNKIFKKGRSEALKFKKEAEAGLPAGNT
jgi:UPF0176 protein